MFSAGADKAARAYDVPSGQSAQVAAHDAPIKCVRWINAPTGGILATGSWDKTIKERLHFLDVIGLSRITPCFHLIVLGYPKSNTRRDCPTS